MAPPAAPLAILQVMCVHIFFNFEIRRAEVPVLHPQLDAAWVRRGEERRREELRRRTRESVERNPSSPHPP